MLVLFEKSKEKVFIFKTNPYMFENKFKSENQRITIVFHFQVMFWNAHSTILISNHTTGYTMSLGEMVEKRSDSPNGLCEIDRWSNGT